MNNIAKTAELRETFLFEYANECTRGKWKRTTFGHCDRPVKPPKSLAEALCALADEAKAWTRGTHLRIVQVLEIEFTLHETNTRATGGES